MQNVLSHNKPSTITKLVVPYNHQPWGGFLGGRPLSIGENAMGNTMDDIITERIMETLQQGEIPWHMPWSNELSRNYRRPVPEVS